MKNRSYSKDEYFRFTQLQFKRDEIDEGKLEFHKIRVSKDRNEILNKTGGFSIFNNKLPHLKTESSFCGSSPNNSFYNENNNLTTDFNRRFQRLHTNLTNTSFDFSDYANPLECDLRVKSVDNDKIFRTDGFKFQNKLKKLEEIDPDKITLKNLDCFLEKIEILNPKEAKKNDIEDYKNTFIVDTLIYNRDTPMNISFQRRMMVIISIDCRKKNFPCHVQIDRRDIHFDFFVTFDGRIPGDGDCDCSFAGDSFIIDESPYNLGCRKLLILMKRREKVRVMLSVSFTSKLPFILLFLGEFNKRRRQRQKIKLFSHRHQEILEKKLRKIYYGENSCN